MEGFGIEGMEGEGGGKLGQQWGAAGGGGWQSGSSAVVVLGA